MAFLSFMLIILVSLFNAGSLEVLNGINPFQSLSDGATLVSKEGSFELGFFSPGNSSKNRYLGIWYKNIPVRTVVWVANRCNPINDSSGLLTINDAGNLALLNQNKSVVWSTRLSKQAKKPKVELLDSGNLVVTEEEDTNPGNSLWQSFDYPTDTLLPGMKYGWDLRTGLNRRLSAWKTWDDPCSSNFTWGIEFDKQLQEFPEIVMRKGTTKFYRSGPWNGQTFSGTPFLKPNPIFDFVFVNNDDEVYFTFYLKNMSVISILVMNETTSTRDRLNWIAKEHRWKTYSTIPRDFCDSYGLCGPNGNCIISDSPICECLEGFSPKSQEQWSSTDWSQGCVRNKPLSCEKDGFLRISGLKLPDTKNSWVNKDMNINECRAKCLSNCSCVAYSNSNISGQGSGCATWFDFLMDIRQVPGGGQDLYIRVPDSLEKENDGGKVKKVVLIVVAAIGGVSGILLLANCLCRRRNLAAYAHCSHFWLEKRTDINEPVTQNGGQDGDLELPLFNFSIISIATDYFSLNNKLGEGGFGPVYRGRLEDGQEIAVKRLSMSSRQGPNEFKNEVKLIAKLQHRNLVKLLGFCIQEEEKLLAWTLQKEGRPFELLDKCLLVSSYNNLDEVLRCIHIGLLCVQQSPTNRPSMSSVVLMLSSQSDLPQPKQPGYFMEMDLPKGDHSSTKPESSSTNYMSMSLLEAR
ncbi:Mitogen-activated protein kinase kinase kinase [Parasponia andersonii]|uniref:non-specific serine/threonine protein kinase n=1 Tax=Parasponia andersonii TaxID=3476 RepID=A0A2P5BW20_PARAD|nr:Mitogen-activated protein kinase kinase kinase [Parasponia andersonii]